MAVKTLDSVIRMYDLEKTVDLEELSENVSVLPEWNTVQPMNIRRCYYYVVKGRPIGYVEPNTTDSKLTEHQKAILWLTETLIHFKTNVHAISKHIEILQNVAKVLSDDMFWAFVVNCHNRLHIRWAHCRLYATKYQSYLNKNAMYRYDTFGMRTVSRRLSKLIAMEEVSQSKHDQTCQTCRRTCRNFPTVADLEDFGFLSEEREASLSIHFCSECRVGPWCSAKCLDLHTTYSH